MRHDREAKATIRPGQTHPHCLTAATERQRAVTVEFDLINPVAGRYGLYEFGFHRLDEVRETVGRGGA